MSEFKAYPSNFNLLMYAYNNTLIFVVESSGDPFIGTGTLIISFYNSIFSSSLIGINLNSCDNENTLKMSIIPIFYFKC